MKNYSIWKDNYKTINFESLKSDKTVDVLIIGGGITGVSSLYFLSKSDLNVMLVEQNKIGLSTTGNSTGKLTYLQNDLIDKIRNNCGEDVAGKYLDSQIDAINLIVNTIKDEKIDCDLERVYSYIYTNNENEVELVKDLERFLNDNNINTYEDRISLVDSKYMFKVSNTYLINPIKLLFGLLKNIKSSVYENTCIKKITRENDFYICYTPKNIIKAKNIVIASHYPYFLIPFMFPLNSNIEKSFLSASKKYTNPFSSINYTNPFVSMRNYKDYTIYLSYTNKLCKCLDDKKTFNFLIKDLNRLGMCPDYLWSNIDIMTNDGLPYIGKIKENMYIGTGYNTWGLTNGFLAGKIISDIILNENNKYISLFNIKRKSINDFKEITNNVKDNIVGYINGFKKGLNNPKCPHLGCKMLYNEVEKTWDCPCHGSRFSNDGKCISAPSNKNIN